jgi:hypothetical protein
MYIVRIMDELAHSYDTHGPVVLGVATTTVCFIFNLSSPIHAPTTVCEKHVYKNKLVKDMASSGILVRSKLYMVAAKIEWGVFFSSFFISPCHRI